MLFRRRERMRIGLRKAKRTSGGKSVIFRIALLLVAVYTIYSMISLQTQLAQSKSILEQKQALIHEKQISNEQLQDLLENGSEQELIERAAREKLDYVYANEEVYEDLSGK